MKSLINKTIELRNMCLQINEELATKYTISNDSPPISVFINCFNFQTLNLEILTYYYDIWSKPVTTTAGDRKKIHDENGERIILLTKFIFIETLSIIEHTSRLYVKAIPLPYNSNESKYLSTIIKKSFDLGKITQTKYDEWINTIYIRNKVVHNNGYADKTETISVGRLNIDLYDKKMIQGNLDFFLNLSEWALISYKEWCGEYLTS